MKRRKVHRMADTSDKKLVSDALVVFGMTGDLAYKKIFPALYKMVCRADLSVPVIGVASSVMNLAQMGKRIADSLKESGKIDDKSALKKLLSLTRYVDGDYKQPETFAKLKEALGEAKRPVYYLAISPSLFGAVIKGLVDADL